MGFVDTLFIGFAYALLLAGVVFLIIGLLNIKKRKKWLEQCNIVKGKIVNLKKAQFEILTENGWGMETRDIPVVEFSPSESPNDMITFEGQDRMERYLLIGQTVNVRYKKGNAHEADIADFSSNWGHAAWHFVFSFLGLGFGVYSLLMIING
ncbi:DUF3592 domain-containing protein [Neobacillus dielmonensis]|uniref:DUF3592 domain-containing protein n=1 Tax=Neobacillus dielmonensis TaxID=1347369 RepID=UPI0005A62486|nr:DUF3592 domain-containing protein [Neobacillus dielmonensis]